MQGVIIIDEEYSKASTHPTSLHSGGVHFWVVGDALEQLRKLLDYLIVVSSYNDFTSLNDISQVSDYLSKDVPFSLNQSKCQHFTGVP